MQLEHWRSVVILHSAVMIWPNGQFEHDLQEVLKGSGWKVDPDMQDNCAMEEGGQKCPEVQWRQL